MLISGISESEESESEEARAGKRVAGVPQPAAEQEGSAAAGGDSIAQEEEKGGRGHWLRLLREIPMRP